MTSQTSNLQESAVGFASGEMPKATSLWPVAAAAAAMVVLSFVAYAAGWLPLFPASVVGSVAVLLIVAMSLFGFSGARSAHARLLADAAADSPDGHFITDLSGSVVYANTASSALFGFEPKSIDEIKSVCLDDVAEQILENAFRDVRAGNDIDVLVQIRLADANRRQVRLRAHRRGDGAEMISWHSFEVVEMAVEREPAETQDEEPDDILNRLPVGTFSADAKGRFIAANQVFAEWAGIERETLLTKGRLADVFGENADKLMPSAKSDGLVSITTRLGDAGGGMAVHVVQSIDGQGEQGPVSAAVVNDARDMSDPIIDSAVAHQNFKNFFETAPTPIVMVDAKHVVIDVNAAFRRLLPSGQHIRQKKLVDFFEAEERRRLTNFIDHGWQNHVTGDPLDLRLISGDDYRQVEVFASGVSDIGDGEQGLLLHMVDTTQQRTLELQFAQSQKMQAVGQLAGGVAHDFNNLLTAIIGHCDLLLLKTRPGDEAFPDIMQIKQNGNRAANLVRQLLAFSRQQTLRPKVLSLTDVLAELTHLIRRLIGENIQLRMEYSRDLWLVKVDQGQFEQVIINLAVNARDAMTDGGVLEIKTRNVSRSEVEALRNDLLRPDDYVLVEVSDSGKGIKKEDLGRIFEPFFTTKGPGAGTGLGLSTVFGIVKQTGGYVFPQSEVGVGTTFSIYLPVHDRGADQVAEKDEEDSDSAPDLTGIGTLLLVEDEDAVRMFAVRALRNKGYTVLEADSGEAALEVLEEHGGDIDLLISDVVMPNMDGPTLMREVHKERPNLKVIFISGYAEDAFRKNLDPGSEFELLPKPFSLKQLAAKVKEVLGT
jgi:two-component system cell cycle sensor histidine kinase/response regulator CckA